MQLLVKGTHGLLSLNISRRATVAELQEKISQQTPGTPPPTDMRLLLGSHGMYDGTLREHGVQKDSVLTVTGRLFGGAPKSSSASGVSGDVETTSESNLKRRRVQSSQKADKESPDIEGFLGESDPTSLDDAVGGSPFGGCMSSALDSVSSGIIGESPVGDFLTSTLNPASSGNVAVVGTPVGGIPPGALDPFSPGAVTEVPFGGIPTGALDPSSPGAVKEISFGSISTSVLDPSSSPGAVETPFRGIPTGALDPSSPGAVDGKPCGGIPTVALNTNVIDSRATTTPAPSSRGRPSIATPPALGRGQSSDAQTEGRRLTYTEKSMTGVQGISSSSSTAIFSQEIAPPPSPSPHLMGHHQIPGWSARLVAFVGREAAKAVASTAPQVMRILIGDAKQLIAEELIPRTIALATSTRSTWDEDDFQNLKGWEGIVSTLGHLEAYAVHGPEAPQFQNFHEHLARAAVHRHLIH